MKVLAVILVLSGIFLVQSGVFAADGIFLIPSPGFKHASGLDVCGHYRGIIAELNVSGRHPVVLEKEKSSQTQNVREALVLPQIEWESVKRDVLTLREFGRMI